MSKRYGYGRAGRMRRRVVAVVLMLGLTAPGLRAADWVEGLGDEAAPADPPAASTDADAGDPVDDQPSLEDFLKNAAGGDARTPPRPAPATRPAAPDASEPPAHADPAADLPVPNRTTERVTRDQVDLPEGWEPVAGVAPVDEGAEAAAASGADPDTRRAPVSSPPLPLESEEMTLASAFLVLTPWGEVPFARQGAYQYTAARGPGFRLQAPTGWRHSERKHPILGGMQHRFTAPDGLTRLVVAVFPMEEDADLAAFLRERQVELLSSFKPKRARNIILGRRNGLGAYYEGILLMRDVSCHLFLTRHRGKGYMIYGLYFGPAGAREIVEMLHSVRIY